MQELVLSLLVAVALTAGSSAAPHSDTEAARCDDQYSQPHFTMSAAAKQPEFVHTSKAYVAQIAPDFTATVVNPNKEISEIKLSQYRGKYVVLFWYPLDFTFVCPTEIIEFSDMQPEFAKANTVVLGASVDSEYSHLAWMELDRKKGGIGPVNIPLIADLKRTISRDYGVMLESEGHSLRATFIISDKGIIRHMSFNDPPVGRSVAEVLRLVKAFQHTDQWGEACPARWTPGDKTIKMDPKGSLEYFKTVPEATAAAAASKK